MQGFCDADAFAHGANVLQWTNRGYSMLSLSSCKLLDGPARRSAALKVRRCERAGKTMEARDEKRGVYLHAFAAVPVFCSQIPEKLSQLLPKPFLARLVWLVQAAWREFNSWTA